VLSEGLVLSETGADAPLIADDSTLDWFDGEE
jgi:hypothetical protein